MAKISALDDITTLAATDKLPVVDVSDTSNNTTGENKYTTPTEIKTFVLGSGVGVGTNNSGDVVTTDGTQTLKSKTLNSPSMDAATIAGATITGTVTIGAGCTMTSPAINTPTITGGSIDDTCTVEIDAGAVACSTLVNKTATQTMTNKTLTTPVVASVYQDAGKTNLVTMPAASDTLVGKATTDTLTNKTLTTPIVASLYQTSGGGLISVPATVGADTVVLEDTTQTMTAKTLTSPVINTPTVTGGTFTGATIDATSTLNGVAVSTALDSKATLSTQTTHCCTLELANAAGTSDTVTEAEIFTALDLGSLGITAAAYNIIASSVNITLWHDNTSYEAIAIDGTTITAKIAKSGSGVDATLTQIDFAGLTGSEVYYIALSFKIKAA